MLLSLAANNKKTIIKILDDLSPKEEDSLSKWQCEKQEFLRHGKVSKPEGEPTVGKHKAIPVSFEFLPEARRILDLVNLRFGHGDRYLDEVFGEPISQSEATRYLVEYLESQGLEGALQILWSKDIACCGRVVWTGPSARFNKPERMRYSLWLKSTKENMYLRKDGIKGLADHEIGTHYLRMRNDGFQPWFSNRKRFGLRSLYSNHLKITEEGFAAINTLLQLNCRLLWRPAFLYYTACMAVKMTFKELYDHLDNYIWDNDQRWKHVMRVKRHLEDYNGYGGTGKDQCYFAGAVRILRNADDIDFKLLYSGKLCFDELNRVRRISRGSAKLPHFLDNLKLYRHALQEIVHVNCLQPLDIDQMFPRMKMTRVKTIKRKKSGAIGKMVKITKFGSKENQKRCRVQGYPTNVKFAIAQS